MSLPTMLIALTSALIPFTSAVPTSNAGSSSSSSYASSSKRQQAITPETFQIVGNSGVSAQMMFNP